MNRGRIKRVILGAVLGAALLSGCVTGADGPGPVLLSPAQATSENRFTRAMYDCPAFFTGRRGKIYVTFDNVARVAHVRAKLTAGLVGLTFNWSLYQGKLLNEVGVSQGFRYVGVVPSNVGGPASEVRIEGRGSRMTYTVNDERLKCRWESAGPGGGALADLPPPI